MNNDLKEKRLAICEQCLLYKIDAAVLAEQEEMSYENN